MAARTTVESGKSARSRQPTLTVRSDLRGAARASRSLTSASEVSEKSSYQAPTACKVSGVTAHTISESLLERAIGVIYRPDMELQSHYFECMLADQFSAYVWFEETTAVTPLPAGRAAGMPET